MRVYDLEFSFQRHKMKRTANVQKPCLSHGYHARLVT